MHCGIKASLGLETFDLMLYTGKPALSNFVQNQNFYTDQFVFVGIDFFKIY